MFEAGFKQGFVFREQLFRKPHPAGNVLVYENGRTFGKRRPHL